MQHMLTALLFRARGPPAYLPASSTMRLLSSAVAAAAAAVKDGVELEEQLSRTPWLQLLQVPGAGRGLFAATEIEQGMVVHEEAPMLAAPSPHALGTTCHHCLAPLGPGSAARHSSASASAAASALTSGAALTFCSPGCATAAQQAWAQAAAGCDFRQLRQACGESGEKFPLQLAQLACLHIQRHLMMPGGRGASSTAAAAAATAEAEAVLRGDPLTQLRHLCYANIGQPPEPWVHLHRLLLQGLQPLCHTSSGSSSSSSGGGRNTQQGPGQACSSQWLREQFSLQWFCDGMARLHLNCFRVDTIPPLDPADPSALLRAASASLAGAASAAHHTGSAAYLMASMLNHSCEPNLDISFPANNAVAAFTAARDIARHEQLTISYVDAAQGVAQRRQVLQFGYGFTCRCPRCLEEAAVA